MSRGESPNRDHAPGPPLPSSTGTASMTMEQPATGLISTLQPLIKKPAKTSVHQPIIGECWEEPYGVGAAAGELSAEVPVAPTAPFAETLRRTR